MKQKILSFNLLHLFFSSTILFCSCNSAKRNKDGDKFVTVAGDTTTIKQKSVEKTNTPLLNITDTGQQYFKITVTKNNQPYCTYEGDFPIAMFDETNFNIQFPASKRMLKISHFLVLYFKGIAVGIFAIAPSGSEKGKPTIIFTPEKDGAYGIGVSMLSGNVTITKYSTQAVSGNLNAEGKDTDGNSINVTAAFINVKNNNLNQ
jgi:hypothetical protein